VKILHTGLRVDDVELRERSGRVRVRRGKGGKYREVPLNVTVRKVLAEYLESHRGGEWLFVNRNGGRLSERSGGAPGVQVRQSGPAARGDGTHAQAHLLQNAD